MPRARIETEEEMIELDAWRYRKLRSLGSGRAAKLIEEVGIIGLDEALAQVELDKRFYFDRIDSLRRAGGPR